MNNKEPSHNSILHRIAPPLAFLIAICLLVICCYDSGYTALPPTEKRYSAAKANIIALRLNEKNANKRENWENLVKEFRSIYDNDPQWPNRAAALFRAAESMEELARRSFAKSDAKKAIEYYELVALRHADSRLADDALYRAAKMRATWLKDDKGALQIIDRIRKQYPKGDMIEESLLLEKALTASALGRTSPETRKIAISDKKEAIEDQPQNNDEPLEKDKLLLRYRKAREKMETLRTDKNKACWRQPWEKLRVEFQQIYESQKNNKTAPNALFRAGQCQQALADCSHVASEYRQAFALYMSVVRNYPNSAVADDALLLAAQIQVEHLGRITNGIDLIDQCLTKYPNGDMSTTARALRAEWVKKLPTNNNKQIVNKENKKFQSEKAELQLLSWDSPTKNSVKIVLELNAPVAFNTHIEKDSKGRPSKLFLNLDDTTVINDVKKGANIQGSLLQKISVHDLKNGGSSVQFDFRIINNIDTKSENNNKRIILTVDADKPRKNKKNTIPVAINENNLNQNYSNIQKINNVASQLGLTVQSVYIDAGHGGRDPGTLHNNIYERIISLDVALKLGQILEANGLEVIYSRKRDTFISLSERTTRANSTKSDLFISIHVNANPDSRVNGFETYYLDLASNPQAARVAALENTGSDQRLGDMQNMLADLMLNARVTESKSLAQDIQRKTISRMKRRSFSPKDNGVKAAPFHVLIGAQMPAVLVEIGYCTNNLEARNLNTDKYRQAIAEGLAEGILYYKDRLLKQSTAENFLTGSDTSAM